MTIEIMINQKALIIILIRRRTKRKINIRRRKQ